MKIEQIAAGQTGLEVRNLLYQNFLKVMFPLYVAQQYDGPIGVSTASGALFKLADGVSATPAETPESSEKWKRLGGGDDADIRAILESFLAGSSGEPELVQTVVGTNIEAINGVPAIAGLLTTGNALSSYSETGSTFRTWLNIPTELSDGRRIVRIVAKVYRYQSVEFTNMLSFAGASSRNDIPANPSTTLQTFDISLVGRDRFSLSAWATDANLANIELAIYAASSSLVTDAVAIAIGKKADKAQTLLLPTSNVMDLSAQKEYLAVRSGSIVFNPTKVSKVDYFNVILSTTGAANISVAGAALTWQNNEVLVPEADRTYILVMNTMNGGLSWIASLVGTWVTGMNASTQGDTFRRANVNPLTSDMYGNAYAVFPSGSAFAIAQNKLRLQTASGPFSFLGQTGGASGAVELRATRANLTGLGLFVGGLPSGTCAFARLNLDGTTYRIALGYILNGTSATAQGGNTIVELDEGEHVLALVKSGTQFTVKLDGVQVLTFADAAITGSRCGLFLETAGTEKEVSEFNIY